jgi:hypothetical protein
MQRQCNKMQLYLSCDNSELLLCNLLSSPEPLDPKRCSYLVTKVGHRPANKELNKADGTRGTSFCRTQAQCCMIAGQPNLHGRAWQSCTTYTVRVAGCPRLITDAQHACCIMHMHDTQPDPARLNHLYTLFTISKPPDYTRIPPAPPAPPPSAAAAAFAALK